MKSLLLTLTICLLVTSAALAGPTTGQVDIKYMGHNAAPRRLVKYYGDIDNDGTAEFNGSGLVAGYYKHDISYDGPAGQGVATGEGLKVSNPLMFCVDFTGTPVKSWRKADVEMPADYLGDAVRAADLSSLWADNFSKSFSADKAAAFQLAVWEIRHETATDGGNIVYDVTDGNMRLKSGLNSDYATTANSWLSNLSGNSAPIRILNDGQDMLTAIPAPGAILLGSIGVGLVGYLRRKRAFDC